MNRKIIAMLFLLVFLACNIGTAFADDINLDNGNLNEEDSIQITGNFVDDINVDHGKQGREDSTQVIEKIDKESSGSQEETDKTGNSNKNEEPIQERDDGEDEYGEIFDFDTPITRDMTLTLIIERTIVEPPIYGNYYIYFHTNGGSEVINYLSIRSGNPISSPLPKTSKQDINFSVGMMSTEKSGKQV